MDPMHIHLLNECGVAYCSLVVRTQESRLSLLDHPSEAEAENRLIRYFGMKGWI